jgi:phosphatidylinositol alpha-1,6-mannosyltransferase
VEGGHLAWHICAHGGVLCQPDVLGKMPKTAGETPDLPGNRNPEIGLDARAALGLRVIFMRFLLATHEYPPFRGGVARYCQEMALAVARRGHQVTVLAPAYTGKEGRSSAADVEVIRFKGDIFTASAFPRLVMTLWRAVRSGQWDCIHLCDWPLVEAAAVVRRWHPFPFIMTIHGTDVRIYRQARLSRLVGVVRTLAQAGQIVANSQFTADLFRKNLPEVPAGLVKPAYLGVGASWRERPAALEIDAVKERHGIAPESRCVISVARLDRRKGQHIAIEALGCLPPAERGKVVYLVVGHPGDAAYAAELKRLAIERKVDARFLSGLDDAEVRALVAGSEIFVLAGVPSEEGSVEGFGLAYLEAAALGVPSIASNYAAVPEVVRHEQTGWLVAPGSIPELTAALARLLADDTLLTRLADGAREFSRQFTWQRCAEQTYGSKGDF